MSSELTEIGQTLGNALNEENDAHEQQRTNERRGDDH
jgi:hypothetical protein